MRRPVLRRSGFSREFLKLDPNRIPKRILRDPPNEPCADRIHDDIPGGIDKTVFGPDRTIVIGRRPDRAEARMGQSKLACAAAFQFPDKRWQCVVVAQLDQAVPVIRHQYPGEKARVLPMTGR